MTNINENTVNQQLVKNLFDYKDGFLFWKKWIPTAKINIGDKAGYFDIGCGYFRVTINNKAYLVHRIIFLWHKGYLPKYVDHDDGNTINNFIDNLREASKSQNCANRNSEKNSASKYLGVSLTSRKNRWYASITINRTHIYLGSFLKQETAALEYNKAAVRYHKEFSRLNIIQPVVIAVEPGC